MNKLFLTTILILCLPVTTALYGGETWTYHFDYCDQLRVNVTGTLPIHNGEYTILNNCTKQSQNNYVCNCTNDYDFNVSFKTNAINNYTFDFDFDYYKEEPTITITPSGGGGSSGGYSSSWICGNWSKCIDSKTNRTCWKSKTINYTQSKSCVSETKEIKEEETKVAEKEVEEEIIITKDVTLTEPEQNETEVVLPTKEEEGWIYFGIIIITIGFIIFGFYFIKNKRDSDS